MKMRPVFNVWQAHKRWPIPFLVHVLWGNLTFRRLQRGNKVGNISSMWSQWSADWVGPKSNGLQVRFSWPYTVVQVAGNASLFLL